MQRAWVHTLSTAVESSCLLLLPRQPTPLLSDVPRVAATVTFTAVSQTTCRLAPRRLTPRLIITQLQPLQLSTSHTTVTTLRLHRRPKLNIRGTEARVLRLRRRSRRRSTPQPPTCCLLYLGT